MDAGRGGRDDFVGRLGPLERISAAFRDVLTGRSRLVLVSGEAGIGKTALLTHALRDATAGQAITAWGTCLDAERAPGYWPWAQVLRDVIQSSEGEPHAGMSDADRRDLARLVPEVALGNASDMTDELDSERARFRFFDAVARWLERRASKQPLVVVLDDLQWADHSSLQLLDLVMRPHRPVPLLLVGAYRHDELRPEIAELLAALSVRADNIRLHGLSAEEVGELLARTAGDDRAHEWVEAVHGRTGGHPFLVRELSYAFATHGSTAVVPDAAHDLIAARISRLSGECRDLLAVAAVVGDELLPDVLGDLLHRSPPEVASQIDEAVRAGALLPAAGSSRARFAHDLYRQTVYNDLSMQARLASHQQVGAALERRLARGGTVFAAEIARHFAAAAAIDGPDRAIRWALEASDADRARLAFAEAATQLSRVRAALDDAGVAVAGDVLLDLLVAQADAEGRAGDPQAARELFREARTHALRLGDPERLARVALGQQRLGARFAMPREEIVAFLEQARTEVAGRFPAIEAQITASLARELHHSVPGERSRAQPLSERAVAIARDLDDPATLAACLLARHDVLWTPGAAAKRVSVAREIVSLAEVAGDDERRSEGHLLAANALLESGSPAFRIELDAFLRIEEQLGQPRHDYLGLTRRAAMALLDGSIGEGERLVHEASALGERIGEPDAGNVRMSQLLEVARARGDARQLRATAEMAVAWWTGIPSHAHAVAAGLFAEAGELDAARRALDTVRDLGTWREDRSYLWSVFVGGLTAAAARLDDRELSAELLEELLPLVDACGVNGAVVCFAGSLAHWAGVAAKTLGRTEQARGLLLQAVQVHERLGARAWEATTCAELAEIDDDASYRDRAAALAEELGLIGIAARVARTSAPGAAPAAARCHRDGDTWNIAYRGHSVHLRDAKGLHDLVALLARPGQEISVLDLAGSGIRGSDATAPVLDVQARTEFRRRIDDLDEELAEAETNHDLGRKALLETEREALLDELRRATGAGGKDRGLGARTTERARKAVTARLRDTIARIGVALPDLGAHLDRSIVTGNHCRYEPIEPLDWDLI